MSQVKQLMLQHKKTRTANANDATDWHIALTSTASTYGSPSFQNHCTTFRRQTLFRQTLFWQSNEM